MTEPVKHAATASLSALLSLSVLCKVDVAWAHGPPPAILQVVAATERGPTVVRMTEGLAVRLGDRWVYVCPSLFGSEVTPRALSVDGRVTWVASPGGTFILDESGNVRSQMLPPGVDGPLIALARAGGGAFGLRFSTAGIDVIRLDHMPPEVMFHDTQAWPLFAGSDDRLFLARSTDTATVVRTLDASGQDLSTVALDSVSDGVLVALRSTAGELYSLFSNSLHYELFRMRDGAWELVLASDSALYGPVVTADGTTWVSEGAQIVRLTAGGLVTTPISTPLTCLDAWSSSLYACPQDRVSALGDEELGPALMQLAELEAPTAADGNLVGGLECGSDWQLFRNDLENIGIRVSAESDGGSTDGGVLQGAASGGFESGCACRHAPTGPGGVSGRSWPAWLLFMGAAIRARLRRTVLPRMRLLRIW